MPPVSSRTMIMSVPSTSSFLSGDESSSALIRCAPAAGWHTRPELCECRAVRARAAFRAARCRTRAGPRRPSASRRPPARDRWSPAAAACRSYESRCRRAGLRSAQADGEICSATLSRTFTASHVTSVPMPSPGRISRLICIMIPLWRTHSCVPRSHSCERLDRRFQPSGSMSACATRFAAAALHR